MFVSSKPLIIYIHGFQSSPLSEKAEETRQYLIQHSLAVEFITPQLSNYPGEAFRQLQQLLSEKNSQPVGLIGSSLGGFMATALAQEFDLKAVLVNPAVRADKLIVDYLGPQQNPYTGESFELRQRHIDELRDMVVPQISNLDSLLILLQTGDETLDYRQAVSYYQGCLQRVEQGGDHRFQNYARHLPDMISFLDLIKTTEL